MSDSDIKVDSKYETVTGNHLPDARIIVYNHHNTPYKYAVYLVNYRYGKENVPLPAILDYDDYIKIDDWDASWKTNAKGVIASNIDGACIYVHEVVMTYKYGKIKTYHPIVHLNRVGIDNRRKNLLFDTNDKYCNKNIEKKKRTLTLPANSGIDPDEIPTYIWYNKEDTTHGDRFVVKIGDHEWKSTSSKAVSLKYKLEEAKEYLRQLKDSDSSLFEDHCMNGEFTKKGKTRFIEYNEISRMAGYDLPSITDFDKITDSYLARSNVPDTDVAHLIYSTNLLKGNTGRLIGDLRRSPPELAARNITLPRNTYYVGESSRMGGYFVYEKDTKKWTTTSSKTKNIFDKYDSLLQYINKLN